MQQLKSMISRGECSVAVRRADGQILTDTGSSVRPLLRVYESQNGSIPGGEAADRVIGRAAASLMAAAGIKRVFGFMMSEGGLAFLKANGIEAEYEQLVPRIENRTGTDMCPMERAVLGCDDPARCVELIREFVAATPWPVS